MSGSQAAPDDINRAVWAQGSVVERFASAGGWIDQSERCILSRLRAELTAPDVLDIGVGGGRTVPLLSDVAGTYVGIDFVSELVEAASRRFPGIDLRDGDARHLEFADASFDLVVFSINGLDAIDHDDRAIALAEIRRVLRPTGSLVFSTHNVDGPGPSDRPWRLPPMTIRQPRSSAKALVSRATHARPAVQNYRRLHGQGSSGSDWCVETSGAHDFAIMVHYVSRTRLEQELRDAGFWGRIDVLDDRLGQPVEGSNVGRCWYFNVRADVGGPFDPVE